MDHLQRSSSQDLIDDLFKKNSQSNHYQHHHMPARQTLRGFDRSNGFRANSSPKKMTELKEVGRDLYPSIKNHEHDPGPGFYDSPEKKGSGFTIKGKITVPRRMRYNRITE